MRRIYVVGILIVALVSLAVTAATLDDLRRALAWPWNETYRLNVFDCSNMATFVAAYLQEVKGFDTEVVFSEKQNHAWVRVKNVGGRHRIVETTSPLLGYIVSDSSLYQPGSPGINYNLYSGTYEWYEFMNRWEQLYMDLRRKYTRLIKQYNDLVGDYNRLRR